MLKRVLALCLVAFVLGGMGWWLRVELARGLFNGLAGEGWRIEALEGLTAGIGGAGAEQLVLQDQVSGRRVEMRGLRAGFGWRDILARRRLEHLSIERLQVGEADMEAPAAPPLDIGDWLARLRSPLFTEFEVKELRLPNGGLPLFLSARWLGEGLTLEVAGGQWTSEAELRPAAGGGLDASLAVRRGGEVRASLAFGLRAAGAGGYRVEGGGRLDLPRIEELPMPLAGHAAMLTGGEADWRIAALLPADLRALAPADVRLEIGEGAVLRFVPEALPGLDFPELVLAAPLALSFAGEFGPAMEVIAEAASLRLVSLRFADYGVSGVLDLPSVSFRGGPDPVARLEFRAEEPRVSGLPDWLPKFGLRGAAAFAAGEWIFQGTAHLAEAREPAPLRVEGVYRPDGADATVTLTPQRFDTASPLSARFPRWPFPFDLAGGELSAELHLDWKAGEADSAGGGLRAGLTGHMESLAGYHGEIFFQGLSGDLAGAFDSNRDFPFSTPALTWKLERLNAGIDLTELSAAFRLDPSPAALAVDALAARVLGGTLRSSGFDYVFGATRNELELEFHDLRLERVLDLADYPGVEARGGVSGSLPIQVVNGRPGMQEGTFRSEAPGGVIRYSPSRPEGDTVNAGTSLVEQALSDYRFENIEGTVRYTPEGDVDISMRIQGYNPGMNEGQRINLNLNLSDNLPVLLRSLQAGRTIEDMLEGQL